MIGVDTHTDTHDAVLVDALGAVIAQTRIETTPAGHARLQAWAHTLIPAGQRMFWAIEGSRSHGHGLTRHLQTAGHELYLYDIGALPEVEAAFTEAATALRAEASRPQSAV